MDGFDKHGMALSIYFRLLKAAIYFFCFATVLSIPQLFILAGGQASNEVNNALDKTLSKISIGNLGQAQKVCFKNNVKVYDKMTVFCPSGTKFKKLVDYGL